MRKLLIVLLALCILLCGCAAAPGEETTESTAQTAQTEETEAKPDFTFYDPDGNPCSLSDFRGKPVILNFWASWCGPCKSEMPDIEAAYLEYGDEIQFLIVNLTDGTSETVATASEYIAGQGYTFPVYFDSDMDGAETFSVYSIPVTYFIDAQGNVVAYASGTMSANRLQQGIDLLLTQE